MVLVKVKMKGILKNVFGREDVDIAFNNVVDVNRVIQRLLDDYEDDKNVLLLSNLLRRPFTNVLVIKNGVEINNLEGLKTEIGDNDTLTIIPISHGG